MIVTVALVLGLGVFGTVAFLLDRTHANKERLQKQLTGNWELAAGQTQVDRWEIAFHGNGRFQMKLVSDGVEDLSEGEWQVTHARGNQAQVRIKWPDEAAETMVVQFAGGQLNVALPSVGNFTFRAATPTLIAP